VANVRPFRSALSREFGQRSHHGATEVRRKGVSKGLTFALVAEPTPGCRIRDNLRGFFGEVGLLTSVGGAPRISLDWQVQHTVLFFS